MALVKLDLVKPINAVTRATTATASTVAGNGTTSNGAKSGDNAGKAYTYKINGKTYTVKPAASGGYMDAYAQYATDRKTQLDAANKQLNATLKSNNATTNANYDNAARQAYVQYMQRQRALPSQLQALGVNGGATESGLLNLYNNYGSAHAANEQQRNAELATNQQNRDDAYNAAYQSYLSDLNEQKQQAINNQINEYNNEITRFSSSVAQYPTTEKGYQNYKDWIERMKNSDDPLKSMKIALIRQQMATQFPDGKPKSSGGGGGGGGGRRRSYGGRGGGYGGNNTPQEETKSSGNSGNTRAAYEARFRSGKSKKSSRRKAISRYLTHAPSHGHMQ